MTPGIPFKSLVVLLMQCRLCARWLRMSYTGLQSSFLHVMHQGLTVSNEDGLVSFLGPCYSHWEERGRHPTQGLRQCYHESNLRRTLRLIGACDSFPPSKR